MNYKDIIEAKYDRRNWETLLHDIFGNNAEFWDHDLPTVEVNSKLAKTAYRLGTITLADGQQIAVYEVELADGVAIERNRSGIRDILTTNWRGMFAGAFMFCYRRDESILRFSYVSEVFRFNREGDFEKTATATRRYTYLLGEGRGCRTAIEQFSALKNSRKTLDDVTAAFSVEALTKQFYKDLFEWFLWAVDEGSNITFPNDTTTEDDDRDDVEKKIIRMITRIMFVWFIKQKDLVPARLFDPEFLDTVLVDFDPQSTTVGNFYNAILQNLFFATLNRAIEDENGRRRAFAHNVKGDIKSLYRYAEMFKISEEEVIGLFSEVPFLNGGLFECLDKRKADGVDAAYNHDGFSRNDTRFADGRFRYRAVVPNVLFFEPEKGLISILSRYNFTIEENSPEEQQVALDPELLGKVFENLLGAYNPETRETARNQSGSFYTPREIVNYMVDESLIAYLGDTPLVRSLFTPGFEPADDKAGEYRAIADKLRRVKILDPACGSGAFPMGLLNRMVDILLRISPAENPYDLKLSIIENCIYGSDIQSIAAQITKLRFFISLVCDCEKDASKPNFGIPTLPNLETKFVAADSLVAAKKHQSTLFDADEINELKANLKEVRHDHFSAKTAYKKSNLRKMDEELRQQLIRLLTGDDTNFHAEAEQLASWNPYDQNAVASFFDPEWMFGLREGFDIVIGNPPYVQLQNNGGALAEKYAPQQYKTMVARGDLYCLFYERGFQLLKPGGHLCYITSNKWMRAGYGEKTRGFFAAETNPKLLIDFAGVKIFESATVDTNILLFAREANAHKTLCAVTDKQNADSVKNLSVFVEQNATGCAFDSSDSWVILSPIEQSIKRKIESVGTPLKDWDIQINYGIKTGCNEAFIISTEKRNEILEKCATEEERRRTEELIRPILRGRDIKRYGYEWKELWVILAYNGIYKIMEEQYPAIYAHLSQYEDLLKKRGQCRYTASKRVREGADYPGQHHWLELDNNPSIEKLEDFLQPKIVYPNMTKYMPFVYDDKSYMTNQKCFIITGCHVAYLTAFFNSSLFKYCFRDNFPELQGGTRELSKIFFDKLPVLHVDDTTNGEFVTLIQDIQREYTREKATHIDELLFSLYGLSEEERQAIGFVEIK